MTATPYYTAVRELVAACEKALEMKSVRRDGDREAIELALGKLWGFQRDGDLKMPWSLDGPLRVPGMSTESWRVLDCARDVVADRLTCAQATLIARIGPLCHAVDSHLGFFRGFDGRVACGQLDEGTEVGTSKELEVALERTGWIRGPER